MTVDELMELMVDWYGTHGPRPHGSNARKQKFEGIRVAIEQALAEARGEGYLLAAEDIRSGELQALAERAAQPKPEPWTCPKCGSPRRAHVCHQAQPEAQGFAILVDGAVVAWFAVLDEYAETYCQEAWFGRWLTWRSRPPQLIPLTPDEQTKCEATGKELAAKLRGMDDAQAAK